MIGAERVIAIVPARGGSKGIPRKNLADLGGHPLIAWPIIIAARTPCIDRIIVSTDDPEIAAAARRYGAEIADRRAELATDTAGVFEVVLDLRGRLREAGEAARVCVVLEPTSPFRTPNMVDACARPVAAGLADSAATFRPCRTNPHRAWRLSGDVPNPFLENAKSWSRRQDLPPAFEISGEVYAFDIDMLDTATRSFLFGRAKAHRIEGETQIDIDGPLDLALARLMFETSPIAPFSPDA